MKRTFWQFFILFAAMALFSCGRDANPKGTDASREKAPDAKPAPVELLPEVLEAVRTDGSESVKLDEGVFEAMEEAAQSMGPLGKIFIDTSSMASLEQTIKAIDREVKKLPQEEQKKIRQAFMRYMIDAIKTYPNKQAFMNMQGHPSREAMEDFALHAAQPFNGKTFLDFMDDAETRAKGRPPVEDEMRSLMEEFQQGGNF